MAPSNRSWGRNQNPCKWHAGWARWRWCRTRLSTTPSWRSKKRVRRAEREHAVDMLYYQPLQPQPRHGREMNCVNSSCLKSCHESFVTQDTNSRDEHIRERSTRDGRSHIQWSHMWRRILGSLECQKWQVAWASYFVIVYQLDLRVRVAWEAKYLTNQDYIFICCRIAISIISKQ